MLYSVNMTKVLASVALMGVLNASQAMGPKPCEGNSTTVSVDCQRGSGLIQINIQADRRIGKVQLVVKDASGKTMYVEEGKALTEELVRRLDKGMFPKGAATVTVESKDFSVTEAFTIQ